MLVGVSVAGVPGVAVAVGGGVSVAVAVAVFVGVVVAVGVPVAVSVAVAVAVAVDVGVGVDVGSSWDRSTAKGPASSRTRKPSDAGISKLRALKSTACGSSDLGMDTHRRAPTASAGKVTPGIGLPVLILSAPVVRTPSCSSQAANMSPMLQRTAVLKPTELLSRFTQKTKLDPPSVTSAPVISPGKKGGAGPTGTPPLSSTTWSPSASEKACGSKADVGSTTARARAEATTRETKTAMGARVLLIRGALLTSKVLSP